LTTAGTEFIEMRVTKATGSRDPAPGSGGRDDAFYIVLDEVGGERRFAVEVSLQEAFPLAAALSGVQWRRPMTYELMTELIESLGGQVRQVRVDRLVEGAYAATVELEGPAGLRLVDARCSDALNLAVRTAAPVLVSLEVQADCDRRQQADTAEAAQLRWALTAEPMTIQRAEPET
jgi:bifunctional DNase/RNase